MMPTRARSERQYRRRQPEDHYNLHCGHHGLHPSAEVNREAIEHGEKDDNRNRHLDPVIRHRQKTFEKRHGADRVCGDRTRGGDPESRPSKEKAGERAVRLAQKTYSPPAAGNRQLSSAYVSAPMDEST